MQQAPTAHAIERELRIEAPPSVVYSHFVEPEKLVRWMGRDATVNAHPGGDFFVDYNGFDRMRGRFVELVPERRIVFTWGWATLGTQTPPFASTVEVTLTPDGSGTLLRLVHSGFDGADEVEGHSKGWDVFLPFLAEAARTGESAQPSPGPLNDSERAASRLNALLCDLRYFIEGADDPMWSRTCPGSGWPIGVTAQHAVSHLVLVQMAAIVAAGERPPVADFTIEARDSMNAETAEANTRVSREDVLRALLADGPAAVEQLKGIDPDRLSRTQPMAFADGAPVAASMLIQGPLLEDLAAHIEDIRAAAG